MQKKNKVDADLLRSIESANNIALYSDSLQDSLLYEDKKPSIVAYIVIKDIKKEVRCLKYSKTSNKTSINILATSKILTEVLQNECDKILLSYGERELLQLNLLNAETFSFKKNKKDYDNYIIKFKWKV
jgi:hypothetical protein